MLMKDFIGEGKGKGKLTLLECNAEPRKGNAPARVKGKGLLGGGTITNHESARAD